MIFKYKEWVLEQLLTHGILPDEETPPVVIHEYINGLYLYEIRKTKYQMLAGEFPKALYSDHSSNSEIATRCYRCHCNSGLKIRIEPYCQ